MLRVRFEMRARLSFRCRDSGRTAGNTLSDPWLEVVRRRNRQTDYYPNANTGAEQTWQVSPGVSSVQVTAVGGSGSSNVAADGTTVAGGKGAKVSATVPPKALRSPEIRMTGAVIAWPARSAG